MMDYHNLVSIKCPPPLMVAQLIKKLNIMNLPTKKMIQDNTFKITSYIKSKYDGER
jgi:hypothetical protein